MPGERIRPRPAEEGMTAWDYGAVIALAAVGFCLSYDALREVAVAIHVRPALSYFFPVVLDGFIAYGVRAIVLLRNRPFGARLYAWFLFLTATGASLWANALHAVTLNRDALSGRSALYLDDGVVGILSTLAPLALAGSVHLYILMARTAVPAVRDHRKSGPGPDGVGVPSAAVTASAASSAPSVGMGGAPSVPAAAPRPSIEDNALGTPLDLREEASVERTAERLGEASEAPHERPSTVSDWSADGAGAGRPNGSDRTDDREESAAAEGGQQLAVRPSRDRTDGEEGASADGKQGPEDRESDDAWLDELLPIARAASQRAGRVSRDAVKDAVRAHHPIGNERLGVLVARLRQEEEVATGAPGCSPASPR